MGSLPVPALWALPPRSANPRRGGWRDVLCRDNALTVSQRAWGSPKVSWGGVCVHRTPWTPPQRQQERGHGTPERFGLPGFSPPQASLERCPPKKKTIAPCSALTCEDEDSDEDEEDEEVEPQHSVLQRRQRAQPSAAPGCLHPAPGTWGHSAASLGGGSAPTHSHLRGISAASWLRGGGQHVCVCLSSS